ncbi:hypothetical protein ACLOJK_016158 [Asimina triloba]
MTDEVLAGEENVNEQQQDGNEDQRSKQAIGRTKSLKAQVIVMLVSGRGFLL